MQDHETKRWCHPQTLQFSEAFLQPSPRSYSHCKHQVIHSITLRGERRQEDRILGENFHSIHSSLFVKFIIFNSADPKISNTNSGLPKGKHGVGGINSRYGINIYTLPYIKQISHKVPLYSTGKSTQHSVIIYMYN